MAKNIKSSGRSSPALFLPFILGVLQTHRHVVLGVWLLLEVLFWFVAQNIEVCTARHTPTPKLDTEKVPFPPGRTRFRGDFFGHFDPFFIM